MSNPGETYQQWLERTAPQQRARPVDTRRWDLAVIFLLGVFFLWVGGEPGWIGLGLVLVLVAEQVFRSRLDRGSEPTRSPDSRVLRVRGIVLLATVALSLWLVFLAVEASPLPLLLVLLDVKDEHSFLRRVAGSGPLSRRRRPR